MIFFSSRKEHIKNSASLFGPDLNMHSCFHIGIKNVNYNSKHNNLCTSDIWFMIGFENLNSLNKETKSEVNYFIFA